MLSDVEKGNDLMCTRLTPVATMAATDFVGAVKANCLVLACVALPARACQIT